MEKCSVYVESEQEALRYKWIESEKAGHDIGFEKAAEDWLKRFSKTWIDYHMPKKEFPPAALLTPFTRAIAKNQKQEHAV